MPFEISSRSVMDSDNSSASSPQDGNFRNQAHSSELLLNMQHYLKGNELTDVVLICGQHRIPAHRLVLAAASDYFAAMFTRDVVEATQAEVTMVGVNEDSMVTLVQYCYTGELELTEENVENLLSTANIIQLTKVVKACCEFLRKQLHPSNCIGIQLFAASQGCKDLFDAALDYTTEHFEQVIGDQEFLMVSPEEIEKLLACDDLNVPNEECIFNALLAWLNHDLEKRKEHLPDLLECVKLPLLSPEFLTDNVESNPLFKENRRCNDLVMEAMKYHLLPERRSSLQSPRTRPRKSTVGCLYVVGGTDAHKGPRPSIEMTRITTDNTGSIIRVLPDPAGCTSMERYSYRANRWMPAEFIAGRRLQFGVAVLQNKLYVVGGRDGLKTLNTVECYDPNTNVWSSLPPMSTHRHGLGVGVLEGPLYAVGGHDGWSYLNTVERWDPGTRHWSYVSPMSIQRSTVGVAAVNGKLYAVGGRDGSSCLKTVECYDPHTNKWTHCQPMWKRRGGVGVGVLNGFVYALGGHDAPASNPGALRFESVERYDPQTDTWTLIASLNVGRDAVGVCSLGHLLFAVGGYDGQSYLDVVEAYDPETNEWKKMASLAIGRAGACVVAIKTDRH